MSKVRSRTWDGVPPCRRASSHWRRHLVCMGLLACVRVATSQVVGVGSECHQAEVRDAMARVRAQLPGIERILTELEEAKYECRVFRTTTGTATVGSAAHHAEIAWPGTSGRYADDSCIDADATLVHEIYHCWVRSKNDGEEPCTYVPTRTVSGVLVVARASCEFDAVAFENRYRKAIGICERLAYGNFQVPGAERTCPAPETACPAFTGCSAPARTTRVIDTGAKSR
jgi:hypothetical protein